MEHVKLQKNKTFEKLHITLHSFLTENQKKKKSSAEKKKKTKKMDGGIEWNDEFLIGASKNGLKLFDGSFVEECSPSHSLGGEIVGKQRKIKDLQARVGAAEACIS